MRCKAEDGTYRSMQTLSPLLRSGSAYRVEMHLAWQLDTSLLNTSVIMSSCRTVRDRTDKV